MATPEFRRVLNDLVHLIESGQLRPGERLLSYSQLAAKYGVSVSTVQRALAILHDRGLIVGHQGKATFVAGGDAADAAGASPVHPDSNGLTDVDGT